MMNKKIVGIIVCILFFGTSIVSAFNINLNNKPNKPLSRGWLYVGGNGTGNYTTIQSAINDANPGDTIFVYNGIYYEDVDINKKINLLGESQINTIIEGFLHVVIITADEVKINNFSIKNSDNGLYGISISSNLNIIDNCTVFNTSQGIFIYSVSQNIITNCTMNNNDYGIGIHGSSNNTILNCYIFNNSQGIQITFSSYNIIYNKTITKNNYYGIYIADSSSNNGIFHNNLIKNTQNAKDEGNNIWDNGYPSGGNYWDDYTGIDSDGDGIGDTPYLIPGGDNEDRYPLMEPLGNVPPSAPIINGTNSGKSGVEYDFVFTSIDPDCDDVRFIIGWGDGDNETTSFVSSGNDLIASHTWTTKGTYTISTVAEDEYYLTSSETTLEVTIPRNKALLITQPILLWLLGRFPILIHLIGY